MRVSYIIICFLLFFVNSSRANNIVVVGPELVKFMNKDGSGIHLDFLKMIFNQPETKINYQVVPLERAIHWIEQGKADVFIGNYSKCHLTELGFKYGIITPTFPFSFEKTVAVFKHDSSLKWSGLKSFTNQTVGSIRGYGYDQLIDTKMQYLEFATHKQLWGMLNRYRVKFIIDDFEAVNLFVAENNLDIKQYNVVSLFEAFTYIALTSNERGIYLAELFDRRYEELLKTNYFNEAYEKYQLKNPLLGMKLIKNQLPCPLSKQLSQPK